MIAIVDYGVNNLRSVQKALEHVGADAVVTDDKHVIRDAQGVILPGVGAFGDAMVILHRSGLDEVIRDVAERKIPLLGICLGMQLLFDESEEMGAHRGLGILPGKIVRLPAGPGLRYPHIGWNQIHPRRAHVLLDGVEEGAFAYFVHSTMHCRLMRTSSGDDRYGCDFGRFSAVTSSSAAVPPGKEPERWTYSAWEFAKVAGAA